MVMNTLDPGYVIAAPESEGTVSAQLDQNLVLGGFYGHTLLHQQLHVTAIGPSFFLLTVP